jgi:hypothetical protein
MHPTRSECLIVYVVPDRRLSWSVRRRRRKLRSTGSKSKRKHARRKRR